MTGPITVSCNGARLRKPSLKLIHDPSSPDRNVRIAIPEFVARVYHLPDAILDLIELAAFIYAADRLSPRGPKDALEYHAWARTFKFNMRVRSPGSWSPQTARLLAEATQWVTGDKSHEFTFGGGHTTPPSSLFDVEAFALEGPAAGVAVLTFSGGLDSLAGALWLLESTSQHVCLVSHQTQPKTKRTQNALAEALASKYLGRVSHYKFECHLVGPRAPEESQRSRSFLYSVIAYSIAKAYGQDHFYVFENGVTSINIGRRQDMLNARSSRTTHPQTLGRFSRFFSGFGGAPFEIRAPFLWKTKRDVIETIVACGGAPLISSAVSCTSSLKHVGQAPQCGECFQCIDRRLASFAAGGTDWDYEGLYDRDVFHEPFRDPQGRTTAVDYLRQAYTFGRLTAEAFYDHYMSEMAALLDWLPGISSEITQVEAITELARRHSKAVADGLRVVRSTKDPYEPPQIGSFLQLIAAGEHTKPEVLRLVTSITEVLRQAVPPMFRKVAPVDENDFNRKVGALLRTHHDKLRSEHPLPRFACAGVVADHELESCDLIIESKYIRGSTSPSKATDGVLVDLLKYPVSAHILITVLDREGAIPDDGVFISDIENRRSNTTVVILR